MIQVLNILIATATNLHDARVPACDYTEEWGHEDGHWSGTKANMEQFLGRDLTQAELTAMSIGRGFGPSPLLTEEQWDVVVAHLWPEGNSCGEFHYWKGLAERLRELRNKLDAQELKVRTSIDALAEMPLREAFRKVSRTGKWLLIRA